MPLHAIVHSEKLELDLATLEHKCKEVGPFLTAVGAYMLGSVQKNFDAEAAPNGAPWAPLAEATIKQRLTGPRKGGKAAHPDKILQDTGQHLAGTINAEVSGQVVRIGPSPSWSGIHQYGGKAGKGHAALIPARPFLGFRPEDPAAIEHLGLAFLSLDSGAIEALAAGGSPLV